MRTLDQGETAAVERQHPPIGPTQPVALLDLRIAKTGFAGDPRAELCKFAALLRLALGLARQPQPSRACIARSRFDHASSQLPLCLSVCPKSS